VAAGTVRHLAGLFAACALAIFGPSALLEVAVLLHETERRPLQISVVQCFEHDANGEHEVACGGETSDRPWIWVTPHDLSDIGAHPWIIGGRVYTTRELIGRRL
jgi:hypothetical protein